MARCFLILLLAFLAITISSFAAESPASAANGDNSTPAMSIPSSSVTTPFAAMAPGTNLMDDIAPSEDDIPVDDEAASVAPSGTPIVANAVPEESGDNSGSAATEQDHKNSASSSTFGKVSLAAITSVAAVAGYFVF